MRSDGLLPHSCRRTIALHYTILPKDHLGIFLPRKPGSDLHIIVGCVGIVEIEAASQRLRGTLISSDKPRYGFTVPTYQVHFLKQSFIPSLVDLPVFHIHEGAANTKKSELA